MAPRVQCGEAVCGISRPVWRPVYSVVRLSVVFPGLYGAPCIVW